MENSSLILNKMLQTLHKISYEEFLLCLQKAQKLLSVRDSPQINFSVFSEDLEKIFNEKILTLKGDDLDPQIASRWQSLQTEVCRAFRLLKTDMMFLRSSINSNTIQARIDKVSERLTQLISYCEMILVLGQ